MLTCCAAGFTKEKTILRKEIEQAVARIEAYKANPEAHRFSHEEENDNG